MKKVLLKAENQNVLSFIQNTYQVVPLRTRGRNPRSKVWLKGPWPTSCSNPGHGWQMIK